MEKTLLTAPLSLTEIEPELLTFTDKFKGTRSMMQLVAHSQSNVVTQTFDMQSLSELRGGPNI